MAARALAHPIPVPVQEIEGSPLINEEEVAIRAYFIWQQCGEPHGHDLEHWFQAISELEHPYNNDSQKE